MKKSQFLGTLLPSHPAFQPLIQQMREKYGLREVLADQDPITEIFLADKEIPLEDFREEIKALVGGLPDFLPPDVSKILSSAKGILSAKPANSRELRFVPKKLKLALIDFWKVAQSTAEFAVKILDQFDAGIADMLYIYLLIGETQELPKDWISKVVTGSAMGEPVVVAMATQIVNPDVIIEQFRQEMKKTFGPHRPSVTNIAVSTAYFMQLQRLGKKWDFIVEEYIRLNHFKLPRDRSSPRFFQDWHRYERQLRKRIQRTETVLDILVIDKK